LNVEDTHGSISPLAFQHVLLEYLSCFDSHPKHRN